MLLSDGGAQIANVCRLSGKYVQDGGETVGSFSMVNRHSYHVVIRKLPVIAAKQGSCYVYIQDEILRAFLAAMESTESKRVPDF